MRRLTPSPTWVAKAFGVLALGLAGCGGGGEVATAREAIGDAPVAGDVEPIAPQAYVPAPVDNPMLASRGTDFLAVWVPATAESAIVGIRFGADGKPFTKEPFTIDRLANEQAFATQVACAPAGDCALMAAVATQTTQSLAVWTLHDDGTAQRTNLVASSAIRGATLGYDGEDFVAIWTDSEALRAIHLRDGRQIEAKPKLVSPTAPQFTTMACAPDIGCALPLVQGNKRSLVIAAPGAAFGAPIPLGSSRNITFAAGDGVFLGVTVKGTTLSALRYGPDGHPLDSEPIPITPPGDPANTQLVGLAFDGGRFLVFLLSANVTYAIPIGVDGAVGAAIGFEAWPAVANSIANRLLACGGDVCEIALPDQKTQILTGLALRGETVTPSDAPLSFSLVPQEGAAVLRFGSRILAAWNEDQSHARERWLDAEGEPDGAPFTIADDARVIGGDAVGDDGILLLQQGQRRETRLVGANGKLGPPIAVEPGSGDQPARFLIANAGRAGILRFAADGHALPNLAVQGATDSSRVDSVRFARRGDDVVVAFSGVGSGVLTVGHALPDGKVNETGTLTTQTDPTNPLRAAEISVLDLACSPDDCVVLWRSSSNFDGTAPRGLLSTRFDPDAPVGATTLIDDLGGVGLLGFDGESFLVSWTTPNPVNFARLDLSGPTGIELGSASAPVAFVGLGQHRSLLFVNLISQGGEAFGVRKVNDCRAVAATPTTDTDTSTSESSSSCAYGAPRRTGAAAGALALLLAAVSARRLRRDGRHRLRRRSAGGRP